MLAASPALIKPAPSSSTEHGKQSSIRYGTHQASAYLSKSQSALAFLPANNMSVQSPHGRMTRPSPSTGSLINQYGTIPEQDTAGSDNKIAAASTSRPAYNGPKSSVAVQRSNENIVNNNRMNYHITRHSEHGSPSIKRRQQSTPPLDATMTALAPTSTSPLKRPKTQKREPKILPIHYEHCEVEDIVILIADMIAELIHTNDNLPLQDGVLTRFHSRTPPGISVMDYLQRLAKHAALTPPLLLSMVYYIDLLCSKYTSFTITTLTVHRFLITAATVAAKGLSDSFWNNSTYARVGGIKLAELGLLELDFLHRVDWRIVPMPEVLVDYYGGLVSRSDKYEMDVPQRRTQPMSPVTHDAHESSITKSAPPGASSWLDNVRTDKKWEKWMKDVAEGTGN